jgi:hypothetical protein
MHTRLFHRLSAGFQFRLGRLFTAAWLTTCGLLGEKGGSSAMAAPQPPQQGSLRPGQKVRGVSTKQEYTIEKFLFHGGQGEIYKVAAVGNSELALKWYTSSENVSEK